MVKSINNRIKIINNKIINLKKLILKTIKYKYSRKII